MLPNCSSTSLIPVKFRCSSNLIFDADPKLSYIVKCFYSNLIFLGLFFNLPFYFRPPMGERAWLRKIFSPVRANFRSADGGFLGAGAGFLGSTNDFSQEFWNAMIGGI